MSKDFLVKKCIYNYCILSCVHPQPNSNASNPRSILKGGVQYEEKMSAVLQRLKQGALADQQQASPQQTEEKNIRKKNQSSDPYYYIYSPNDDDSSSDEEGGEQVDGNEEEEEELRKFLLWLQMSCVYRKLCKQVP